MPTGLDDLWATENVKVRNSEFLYETSFDDQSLTCNTDAIGGVSQRLSESHIPSCTCQYFSLFEHVVAKQPPAHIKGALVSQRLLLSLQFKNKMIGNGSVVPNVFACMPIYILAPRPFNFQS